MSDHAEAVNEPVDPAEVSATSEAVESDVKREGVASPSDSSPENQSEQDKQSGIEALQQRLSKKTWQQREAERERDELRAQLEAMKSQSVAKESNPDIRPPLESDYDDPEEFRKAHDEYTERKFRAVWEQQERARREQETEAQRQARVQSYREKCSAYADTHPEFYKDLEQASLPVPPHLQEYLVDAERSAELTHYLAKNPDHAFRIADMSPIAAARELAKVEYELERAQPKKLSDAPPPMSDVEDGPTKAPGEIREGMTAEEFVKARGGYRLR